MKTRVLELALDYSPLLLIAYGFWVPSAAPTLGALLGSGACLLRSLSAWWRPYLFGASAKAQEEYTQLFARTYQFLLPIENHPIWDVTQAALGGSSGLLLVYSLLTYLQLETTTLIPTGFRW